MKKPSLIISISLILIVFGFINITSLLANPINNSITTEIDENDPTDLYRVVTKGKNEFIGKLILQTEEKVIIETDKFGTVTIPVYEIKTIRKVKISKMVDGEYYFENPQATRYFFAPNGYGLRKGEGYYQNTLIWFNQASIGVTDHFTVGIGTIPLFLFGSLGAEFTPVWLTPKVSIPIIEDKLNIGAGVFAGTVLGLNSENFGKGIAGIAYGVVTYGSRDKNITVGAGFGFAGGEIAEKPAITVSGMYRLGKRMYLVSENYIIPDAVSVYSFGGRYIWDSVSLDFGVFGTGFEYGVIGAPWLSVSIPLGKLRQ